MAIVLAIVIMGWLIAFALGAKEGFEDKPAVAPVQSATPDLAKSSSSIKSSSYKDPLSAA